jgi:hypothetical protein
MQDMGVRERRRAMLGLPHIAPLAEYATKLRRQNLGEVPDFDPLDGGVEARVLFLFEKPGPMTDATGANSRRGSGFISRDNDDPTAEATFNFMCKADLPRHYTLIWNVIPWWNGTRKITRAELDRGMVRLKDLIGLLPKLRSVVLVGRKSRKGAAPFRRRGLGAARVRPPLCACPGKMARKMERDPGRVGENPQS